MANRTQPGAQHIHGTDPQNLVEKIVRTRIHASKFWTEECFGLSAETMVDKAMELKEVGGTYGGNHKACPFLCLVLKFLQLAPEKEIAIEFMANDDYRYMRCLGAFYLRLVGKAADVYQYLEPFYNDYRKIRLRQPDGTIVISHVDEFIDVLLTQERACDIILPRLMSRRNLEEIGALPRRVSALEELLESDEEAEDKMDDEQVKRSESGEKKSREHTESRRDKDTERDRDRDRDRRDRDRDDRERDREHRDRRDRDRGERDDRDIDRRDRDRDKDRDRDRRDRGDRDRDGNRDRERERERNRDRGDRDRDRNRDRNRDRERDREEPQGDGEKKKKKKKKSEEAPADDGSEPAGGGLQDNMSVAAMNKLRAKLGLAPLKT